MALCGVRASCVCVCVCAHGALQELKAFKDGVEYESLRQANEVLKTTIDQMVCSCCRRRCCWWCRVGLTTSCHEPVGGQPPAVLPPAAAMFPSKFCWLSTPRGVAPPANCRRLHPDRREGGAACGRDNPFCRIRCVWGEPVRRCHVYLPAAVCVCVCACLATGAARDLKGPGRAPFTNSAPLGGGGTP